MAKVSFMLNVEVSFIQQSCVHHVVWSIKPTSEKNHGCNCDHF